MPHLSWRATCLLLWTCLGLGGCSAGPSSPISAPDEATGPAWFEDATKELGLDFVHDPGPTGTYFMPHMMGSGAAFFHDGDGTLCLYLLQNAGPESKSVNRLYRQQPDGKFKDVTAGSGLGVAGWNMGVAVADVNNDGLPDILLTQYCGVRLFLNLGGGRFEDATAESGLNNPLWATSAAFLDYDRDGWLDLVVVNYLDYDPQVVCYSSRGQRSFCTPARFPGAPSKLFRNRGPGPNADGKLARVRFEDVSFDSHLGRLRGPGLGVVCADFDGDGWPDIFVANDGEPNRLWMNRPVPGEPAAAPGGAKRMFEEQAASRNVAYTAMGKSFAGMGVAVGDTRNEGLLDLYVTHLTTETNTLWKQGPRGRFRDRSIEAGLTAAKWRGTGFGTLMADFDLDGSVDIAVVNGRVLAGGPASNTDLGFWEPYAERNQLFANDGRGTFRDLSPANKALCGRWNVARGLACADINDDGAPDLLVTTVDGPARLFRNVAPDRGHWLKVRALDPKLKRDAYGAEIRVRAGKRQWFRVVNPAESYLCSSTALAHFGLGATATIDAIEVTWPDGPVEKSREVFRGGAVDRTIVVRRGEGAAP